MPLHTIIEIQMGVTGVQEKRYKLMDWWCIASEGDSEMDFFVLFFEFEGIVKI